MKHVQNSLNSLVCQTNKDFSVFFVNYGSDLDIANQVRSICEPLPFIQYIFYPVNRQPWNKSKALNSVIKGLNNGYCFVADIDMIFHPEFVERAIQLQNLNKIIYFQVAFLGPNDKFDHKSFQEITNFRKSTSEATGLSVFPVKALKELRGFDEFYHFWGAEDTDMHVRLKNAGYEVEYYDKEVLMVHQWHPSYRSMETKKITKDFQINGIVQLNHQHLKFAIQNKVTKVNMHCWGEMPNEEELRELQNSPVSFEISNEKRQVDDLLYGELPVIKNKLIKVVIGVDPFQNSQRYFAKKIIGKKVPLYYSLKDVNDLVLLHLISFYRDTPYYYQVFTSEEYIEFAIKL